MFYFKDFNITGRQLQNSWNCESSLKHIFKIKAKLSEVLSFS